MARGKALNRAVGRVAALLFAALLALSVAAYPAVSAPLSGNAVKAQVLISQAERTRAVAVNATTAIEELVAANSTILNININVTWKGSELSVTVGEALELIENATAEGDLHLDAAKSAYEAGDYLTAKDEAVLALNYYGEALALALAVLKALEETPNLSAGFTYMFNMSNTFRYMTRNGTCPPAWGIEVAVASVLRMAEKLNSTLLSSRRVNYSDVAEEYEELLSNLEELANKTLELRRECNISAAAHLLGEMRRLVAAFIKKVNTELAVKHFEEKLGRLLNTTLPHNESESLLELTNNAVKAGFEHGKGHNKTKVFDVIPVIDEALQRHKNKGKHHGNNSGPGSSNWIPPGQEKGKGKGKQQRGS